MSDKPGKLKLFITELRRRKVTRLATIYVVVALGIIEAVDIIGGRFQIPDGTINLIILLVIGGFPIAMMLSWIFDLTSKGIERTRPLTSDQKTTLPAFTWRPSWVSLLLFIMLISLGVVFFVVPRANALGFQERDWVLLADLENNTDDDVFNRSLMHALSVTIDQSRYVNIFPRRRVLEVLQRMKIDSVGKIDIPLALEIAERENIKTVLVLAISELNGIYLLSTSLLDPYSGQTVRTRQAKAMNKEDILLELNKLATTVRRDLGESLNQIRQQRIPLPKATTPSLDALKFYTDGANTWQRGRWQEAQALWIRAVELDSGFAWANASLGLAAGFLGSTEPSQKYFDRALSQLDRVTEKERLWITALSTGGAQSVSAYETYLQQYPDDFSGWYNLGNALRAEGRTEDAMAAYKRTLTLYPMHAWAYVNLGVGYDELGRTKEAADSFDKAFQLYPSQMSNWGGDVNRISGFVLVKLGDFSHALERFELLMDGNDASRANGIRSMALLKMYHGHHTSAVELFKQAIVLNQRNNAPLSEFRNRMYMARAYQSLGMDASLAEELELGQELAETGGYAPLWTVYLATRLVHMGDIPRAMAWVDSWIESEKAMLGTEWATEILRGEIALTEGNFSEAVAYMELADQLSQGQGLIKEALGRAYYASGQLEQAEASFLETIRLMHLGNESQEPWVLAHYQLGILYEEMGETEKSRIYLEKFLDLWGAGDEGLIGVADARQRLQ